MTRNNVKRRENYKRLRSLGFNNTEATYLKDRSDEFIETVINNRHELPKFKTAFDLRVERINQIKALGK